MINIRKIGFDKFNKKIEELAKSLNSPKDYFEEAKAVLREDVDSHFKEESGPEGPWKKLSQMTLQNRRRKGKGAKILRDTNRMFQSLMSSAKHTSKYAVVGTNMDYALQHQEGKGRIPARPFLWLSNNAGNKLMRIMTDYINKKL